MKHLDQLSLGLLFNGGYLSITTAQSLLQKPPIPQAKPTIAQHDTRLNSVTNKAAACC